jgi:hypothetical protein
MEHRRFRAAMALSVPLLASGCLRIPPPPPETTLNYQYVAPIEIPKPATFYRFDLPLDAPVWKGIELGYGRPSVLDADGKVMRCGTFGYEADSLARPVVTPLSLTQLPNFDTSSCVRTSSDYGRCIQTHPVGDALYEVGFDSVPDVDKQPYPYVRLTWNHPPTQGGQLNLLDDDGQVTAQDQIGEHGGAKALSDSQETRIAVRIKKPALRILIKTRDKELALTSVELITRVRRGDNSSYWFEASGSAPYRLFFDWKHAHCGYAQLTNSEIPPETFDEDWPPIATIGLSKVNPRSLLEKFHSDLDNAWWVLIAFFFPIWVIGIVVALLFRFFSRRAT